MTAPDLRQSRVAIVGYFFILGVATATWAARLPAIKESLHLSDGRLGLALFAVPAGSVLTLALSGRIADKFGAVRVLRVAGVLNPAALVPIGLARNLVALMATLAVYGAMAGLLDVSMNACGARLELGYERPIMSSLHAGYSIAGLAGAGIGGVSAWLGISPLPTFTVTAVALIILGLLAGPRVVLPPVAADPESTPERTQRPEDPPRRSPRQTVLPRGDDPPRPPREGMPRGDDSPRPPARACPGGTPPDPRGPDPDGPRPPRTPDPPETPDPPKPRPRWPQTPPKPLAIDLDTGSGGAVRAGRRGLGR